MDNRFIVSKTFSSGVTTQTILKDGAPRINTIVGHYRNIDDKEYDVELEENFSELKKTSRTKSDFYNFTNSVFSLSEFKDALFINQN